MDMLMTVSGNSIFSSRSGCAASQSVSPVTDSFRPTTPTMSPAAACSTFSRSSARMW
jgi:hypothetical protein